MCPHVSAHPRVGHNGLPQLPGPIFSTCPWTRPLQPIHHHHVLFFGVLRIQDSVQKLDRVFATASPPCTKVPLDCYPSSTTDSAYSIFSHSWAETFFSMVDEKTRKWQNGWKANFNTQYDQNAAVESLKLHVYIETDRELSISNASNGCAHLFQCAPTLSL